MQDNLTSNAIFSDMGLVTLQSGDSADYRINLYRPTLAMVEEFDNADADIIESQKCSIIWAKNLGLINNPRAEKAINDAAFAFNFRYSISNSVTKDVRNLVTDIVSWYFYVDDVIDETYEDSLLPTQVATVLVDILLEKHQTMHTVPVFSFGDDLFGDIYLQVCRSTIDIRDRTKKLNPKRYQVFCSSLADWVRSIPVQFLIHKSKSPQPESSYLHLREINTGMYPLYDLAAITNGTDSYFTMDHFLNRDRFLGAMLVVLMNDIISLPKELHKTHEDQVHNNVLSRYRILKDNGVVNPFQVSLDLWIKQLNWEIQSWEKDLAAREYPSLEAKRIASMYFNGVMSNIDWHMNNKRYNSFREMAALPLDLTAAATNENNHPTAIGV